jgi:hypothetical protein
LVLAFISREHNIIRNEHNSMVTAIAGTDKDNLNTPTGWATGVQAGRFLGITRQAVSLMAYRGEIPYKKFGRSLRVPWGWLLEQERIAREEQQTIRAQAQSRAEAPPAVVAPPGAPRKRGRPRKILKTK